MAPFTLRLVPDSLYGTHIFLASIHWGIHLEIVLILLLKHLITQIVCQGSIIIY